MISGRLVMRPGTGRREAEQAAALLSPSVSPASRATAAATAFAAQRFRKVQVDATSQALRYLKSHGLSVWENLADD